MPDNPFGAPSGSSSGSSAPSAAARVAAKPDIQMVRLAARILRSPNLKPKQARRVQKYFKGFYAQDIQDAAREARLQSSDVERVASLGSERPGTYDVAQAAMTPLKVLSIPGQATLGLAAEGPQGAFKGAFGKEYYAGIPSVLRAVGKSREEANRATASIPGPLRFAGNVAVETLADPTTYIGLGATQLSRGAAETAAAEVARQLGKEAGQNAAKKLFQGGVHALDPEARRIVEQFPRRVRRQANLAQGGLRVWVPGTGSHIVPGTQRLMRGIGPTDTGFFHNVETQTRTLARAARLERSGQLYPGAANDFRDALTELASTETRADLRQVFAKKLMHKFDEPTQVKIMNELDRGGNLARLAPAEREAATKLRGMEQFLLGEQVKAGLLHSPEDALRIGQEAVRGQAASQIERQTARVARVEEAAGPAGQLREYADAWKRNQELKRLAAAKGDTRALERATERENQLQIRAVAEQTKQARQATAATAIHAKSVVRNAEKTANRLERGVKDIERDIRAASRTAEKGATAGERRAARLQLRSLNEQHDATLEAWNRATDDLAEKTGTRDIAVEAAARAKGAEIPRSNVPSRMVSTPIRQAGPESAAAARLSREAYKLRLLERVQRLEQGRLGRLQGRVEEKVAKVEPIPLDEYAPHMISKEGEKLVTGRRTPSGQLSKFLKARQFGDVPARDLVWGVPADLRAGDQGLKRVLPRSEALDKTAPSVMELRAGEVFGKRAAAAERDLGQVRFWNRFDQINEKSAQPFMLNQDRWTPEVKDAIAERRFRVDDTVEMGGQQYVVKQRPLVRTLDGDIPDVLTGKTLIRKEIADDYSRAAKFVEGGDEAKGFVKAAHHGMNLWKAYATTLLPFGLGFSNRNFVGNWINGYWLLGLNPAVGSAEAKRLQHVFAESVRATGDLRSVANQADRQILEDAISHRVIHAGFYTTDLGSPEEFNNQFTKLMFESKGSPLSQKFLPLYYGQRLNNWVEENARLGVFTQLRRRGYDAEAASRLVQRYLFDYADLSTVDQKLKQFIPFWTWTRKNLPLQAETLVKQPGKITAQAHLLDAAREESAPSDPLALQQWMKENEAVVAPFKVGGHPLAVMPDMPITSTYQSLDPVAKLVAALRGQPDAWSQLGRSGILAAGAGGPNPATVALTAAQIAAGQEAFTQRKFKPGEKRLGLPAQLEFLLEQLAPVGPGVAKVRGVLDKQKRTGKLIGLTGLTTAQLNSTTRKNELFRRLAELQAWLASQKLQVPESQFTPSSGGGSSGNPFGGSSSGRTSSSKNPFGG